VHHSTYEKGVAILNFVEPIKNKKQIQKMKEYLHKSNLRDYTLFTFGINSLLRVSDLLNLQLSDVMNSNGTIKTEVVLKEQKTGKTKRFPFNSSIKESLTEYLLDYHNHKDSCLFPSREWLNQEDYVNRYALVQFLKQYIPTIEDEIQDIKHRKDADKTYKSINEIALSHGVQLPELIKEFTELIFDKIDREIEEIVDPDKKKSKKNWGKRIKEETPQQIQSMLNIKGHDPITKITVHRFIKRAGKHARVKENISTHSMRKTSAANIYSNNIDTNPRIMEYLQSMLNHSSSDMTLRYIGINQEIIKNIYLDNAL